MSGGAHRDVGEARRRMAIALVAAGVTVLLLGAFLVVWLLCGRVGF